MKVFACPALLSRFPALLELRSGDVIKSSAAGEKRSAKVAIYAEPKSAASVSINSSAMSNYVARVVTCAALVSIEPANACNREARLFASAVARRISSLWASRVVGTAPLLVGTT